MKIAVLRTQVFGFVGGDALCPSPNFSDISGPEVIKTFIHATQLGAQWLSGRVLDSRPRGRGFEPHRRHCVVVLEQDTFILA